MLNSRITSVVAIAGLIASFVFVVVSSSLTQISTQGMTGSKGPANVQLLLDGPFAICPGEEKDTLRVFAPAKAATRHFDPGFDAELNQQLACSEDYTLSMEHVSGVVKFMPNDAYRSFVDMPQIACPKNWKNSRLFSVLVPNPDEIWPIANTTVTIKGDALPSNPPVMYSSKLLFRYTNVRLESVKIDGPSCDVNSVPVHYPYLPAFQSIGGEVRLTLGMEPKNRDYDHSDAKKTYRQTAAMLGLQRDLEYPTRQKADPAGPHNDCRGPQILVLK